VHRLVALAPTPFEALVRAYCLSVVDSDFRHADFWRNEVSEAKAAFLKGLPARCSESTRHQLLSNAMATGYKMADKSKRYPVPIYVD